MTLMDYAKANVRTVVPYIVGLVAALAARHGVKLDAQETAALTVAAGSAYYAVVRLLERYVTPRFGWLLGLAQQPVYAKVTTRKDPPRLSAALATVAVPILTVVTPETKITGKRLGRHVEHDERSRAYAVTPQPRQALISVRHMRHGSVLNQGNLGSCTGNAGTGAMMTDPFPGHRLTEAYAKQLYSDATKVDGVPGAWPPDDTGSSGLAVAKVLHRRGLITGYQHCFSPDAVYTALQTGPVLVGVAWLSGFDQPTPDGQMIYSGQVRGGHELCMDEIDVENERVWITNSWGRSWSLKGRAWWSFADFAKVMAAQGDAVVPIR